VVAVLVAEGVGIIGVFGDLISSHGCQRRLRCPRAMRTIVGASDDEMY
jgi:hypothetical protein